MQLTLNLKTNIDIYDFRNFIVHSGNKNIFDFVTSSTLLNNNIFLLTGKKGSGKTYLCKIWEKLKGAKFLNFNSLNNFLYSNIEPNKKYILEDINNTNITNQYDLFNYNITEKNMLFLINTIIEKNSTLLITSENYINEFNFDLLDLQSRFKNIYNFILSDINEDIKYQILFKLITDKQIYIKNETIQEISQKLNNSYENIINFVNDLEKFIFTNNLKKINLSNIKELLIKY